jgi:predicted dehydrogenase
MTKLRVGVLGCGVIAQTVHLNVLQRLPEVEIAAIADSDEERRREAANQVKTARAYADYREVFQDKQVDAVIICLPTGLHCEAALQAMESGKHLYLEKPLAASKEDCVKILHAWEKSGLVGMIGFNYRFHPLYQEAHRILATGDVGKILAVRSVFSGFAEGLPVWKRTRGSGGGVLLDLGSHHIDLLHFLFDTKIVEVFARIRTQISEADVAFVQLRMENDVTAQSMFSLSSVEDDRFEIFGTEGRLSIDRYLSTQVEVRSPRLDLSRAAQFGRIWRTLTARHGQRKIISPRFEPSYQSSIAHFVRSVLRKEQAHPDFMDAYRSFAVIEAAEESARKDRPVPVG